MAAGESWRDSESETLSQGAGALAEDNRRLQEMLHSALRRETEALQRVKHLSELLSECRVASETPSSGPELAGGAAGEGGWEGRGGWEMRGGWEAGESDPASPHSQCSDVNLSPSLVVSPPFITAEDSAGGLLEPTSPLPAALPVEPTSPPPTALPVLSTLIALRSTMSSPELIVENGTGMSTGHHHSSVAPETSLPVNLLAPALQTIGDVRRERERPPPPQRSTSPTSQPVTPDTTAREDRDQLLDPPTLPAAYSSRKSHPAGHQRRRSEQAISGQPTMRSRAKTILRPSWLRKRSYSLAKKAKSRPSGSSPASIPGMFSDFLEHSSHITTHTLAQYIEQPWSRVCRDKECAVGVAKYRSAVWELFQCETKYLCHQLQPLEQVYKAFLEELQFYGFLAVADVQKMFANLSELVELSVSVATDLFHLFDGRRGDMIAATNELILAFSMFGHKWNPVYQRFCVNMERQRGFVKALHQLPDFQEYAKACRSHRMVQRSDLTDLLIAPMQHQCHYQLLLENVLKATSDPSEKSLLTSAIKAFVVALKELEGSITANQRSTELLELQETLSWPPVASLCPDSYIPEGLSLEQQPCRDRLATPSRQLLHSGALRLLDNRGRLGTELQVFLFTDMILLAEPSSKAGRRELVRYTVFRQPLFLHWLEVHSLPPSPKHCLTLVHSNSLHQLVAAHTLQASCVEERDVWVTSIQQAQQNHCHSSGSSS